MSSIMDNIYELIYLITRVLNLIKNNRVLAILKKHGIYENYIFENFCIGYANGELIDLIGKNEELKK